MSPLSISRTTRRHGTSPSSKADSHMASVGCLSARGKVEPKAVPGLGNEILLPGSATGPLSGDLAGFGAVSGEGGIVSRGDGAWSAIELEVKCVDDKEDTEETTRRFGSLEESR